MSPEEVKSLFDGFDPSQYEEEVKQRWGRTDASKESARRTKRYGKEDWDRYKREAQAIGEPRCGRAIATRPATRPARGLDAPAFGLTDWARSCAGGNRIAGRII